MAENWQNFNAMLDSSFAYIGVAAVLLAIVGGALAVKGLFAIMRMALGGAAFLMLVMVVVMVGDQWIS